MREGVKIVITIVVLLIIAFALVFVASEHLLKLDEDSSQKEDETTAGMSYSKCVLIHGSGEFDEIFADECPPGSKETDTDGKCKCSE
ncbi:MAG: hypothetical protein B6U87_00095 [Candidatus Aenigmarchaeota archaeon ex4484_52]|nr:MAG: hypothetical protein B6U87_00095 [Candidatus Aenigmarchaeota archaeon ex4484_52]